MDYYYHCFCCYYINDEQISAETSDDEAAVELYTQGTTWPRDQ